MVKKRRAKTKVSRPEPLPTLSRVGIWGPSLLVPIYILLILFGYAAFQSGRATVIGNELSGQRSLFTAINAATLTGFSQPNNVNDYRPLGQAIIFALTIAGILFSFITGGLAVVRIARLPYTDRKIIAWSFASVVIVVAIGAITNAMFQSVSAFGNSGLYIGELPASDGIRTYTFSLPLSVAGGLGLPVLMELADRARGKKELSQHSRTVLTWTSGIYLVSLLLLFILQMPSADSPGLAWRRAIEIASRQAINARSAGFPFEFATYWPRTVQWITIGLMIIGASPAGTGGGIKVTTLAVLHDGTQNALHRGNVGRPFGIALRWLGIYAGLLTASLLSLLITAPQISSDQLLFLASSALGNVGLSHDPVVVSDAGLAVLSATMLLGRITPVLILWWMAETTPESTIAIG